MCFEKGDSNRMIGIREKFFGKKSAKLKYNYERTIIKKEYMACKKIIRKIAPKRFTDSTWVPHPCPGNRTPPNKRTWAPGRSE